MSLGTLSSSGTLLSLPGKQWKKSINRGTQCTPQELQWISSRVELANCAQLQALVSSQRAVTVCKHYSFCQPPVSSLKRVAKVQVCYSEHPEKQPSSDGDDLEIQPDPTRTLERGYKGIWREDTDAYLRFCLALLDTICAGGLFQIAALIGSVTVVSKLLGLVRETVLAAVFGVGPVINAFSYSSIIPGFFLTLLGGINGPFHTAVAASLSKRPKQEGRNMVQRLTIITGMVFGAMSMTVFLLADRLVDALAPGLMVPGYTEGLLTRNLAIIQLKIMVPCAMLAAPIGIGFGTLSAAGVYGVPSLSPALSSISVLIAVSIFVLTPHRVRTSSTDSTAAAVYLAAGATIGALAQWGLQIQAQHRAGFGPLKVYEGKWRNPLMDEGVQEVFAVLLPAAIASGMLQIATYTDLYFASFIPGAAAALGYANLLAMAPVGILSSSILVPILPIFSRLSKPSHELELEQRVRQGLLLSMVLTLLMTALMVPLARPIVQTVFQRHAFDASASRLVSSLLIWYVLGSTFYLARDLLVRVFYALGDGRVPCEISIVAIVANALLDWLMVQYAGFGVQGVVVATSLVNCGSALILMVKLSSKFQGFRLQHWVRPLLLLGCSATVAGTLTKYTYDFSIQSFSSVVALQTRYLWATDLLSIILASAAGVVTYIIPLFLFQVPEIKSIFALLHARM